MNKKIISFDYDNTLSNKEEVQDYCKELIEKGIEVHIVTTRYDDLHAHLYASLKNNNDMYQITDILGIRRENIHFMNFQFGKANYLFDTKVLWHLDDDEIELKNFKRLNKVKGIYIYDKNWKEQCEKLLNQ